jgi:UDP-N-acetylglucosamine--N-acetylmuramyl-(pentapeptide) pyrophosphoryl-undecaprenol N-acetylglucosamine transferase
MNRQSTYRILIGGGGTGGHVFPAIAIADALKAGNPGLEFLFVGALGRLEMEKVPEAGYRIVGLPVAGFQRKFSWKNFSFIVRLLVSIVRSRRIIRRFRPHAAVGVGGYASGPILRAAARKKVPILIQEQNSYAGVTNRILARSAQSICVAYEHMERYFPADRIVLTGNPVRRQLMRLPGDRKSDLGAFSLEEGKQTCLVLGGSLGARTINQSIMEGLDRLGGEDLQVIWQCGSHYREEAERMVRDRGMEQVRVHAFITEMDRAYNAADLIVSRAGAITISELCLLGKPVILIPSPNVAEDHQTRNAEALVSRNAAVMIPDHLAREELVERMLELVHDAARRKELSMNIKQLGVSDAAQRIAAEVIKIIQR